MYKGCIFDLDGTLTDTLDSLLVSVNATLEEMKLGKITRDECRAFVGNGARYLMEKAIEAVGGNREKQIEEGMKIYRQVFDRNCMYHVEPYDGILDLLQFLKKKEINLAVLSNKPHQQAVHVVEDIFGKTCFSIIQGQQDGIPRKPDPGAALAIAEDFKIKPSECIYIGDSEVDIATGKSAGMMTVGVTWGFRKKEQLQEAGATKIVALPSQIGEMLIH